MADLETTVNYGGSAAILGTGTLASAVLLPWVLVPAAIGVTMYGAGRFFTRGKDETINPPGMSPIERIVDQYSPVAAGACVGAGAGIIFGGLGALVGGAVGALGGYIAGNRLRDRKRRILTAAAGGAPVNRYDSFRSVANGLWNGVKYVARGAYNIGKRLYQNEVVKTVVNTGLIVGGGLLAAAAVPYVVSALGLSLTATVVANTTLIGAAKGAGVFFGSEYLLGRLRNQHGINNPVLETTLRTIGYGAGSYLFFSGLAGLAGGLASKIAAPLGSVVSQYLPWVGPAATYGAYTRTRLRDTHGLENTVNWIDTLALAGLTYGGITLAGTALTSIAPAATTLAGLAAPIATSGVTSWRLRNVHQWGDRRMILANLILAGLAGYGAGEALGAYTGSGDLLAGAKHVLDSYNTYSQLGLNSLVNGLGTDAVTEGLMGMGLYGAGKGIRRIFRR